MDQTQADDFARAWIAAWNSRDLERILGHYAEDVALTSPFVARVLGPGHGTLRGKEALREYWGKALAHYPDLHFTPFRVFAGVDSLVLHYRSVAGLVGAECMRLDGQGKVVEVIAHYAPEVAA